MFKSRMQRGVCGLMMLSLFVAGINRMRLPGTTSNPVVILANDGQRVTNLLDGMPVYKDVSLKSFLRSPQPTCSNSRVAGWLRSLFFTSAKASNCVWSDDCWGNYMTEGYNLCTGDPFSCCGGGASYVYYYADPAHSYNGRGYRTTGGVQCCGCNPCMESNCLVP